MLNGNLLVGRTISAQLKKFRSTFLPEPFRSTKFRSNEDLLLLRYSSLNVPWGTFLCSFMLPFGYNTLQTLAQISL